MAPVEVYGPVQRVGQAVYGAWFYLLKTVSPQNLSPLYEKRPELWLVLTALLLSTAAVIFLFLFRRKLSPIIGALGAFLLLVFPMLGITQSGSQMFADRFTYFADVPFSILLAAGLARLKPLRRTFCGALAVLVLIFGIQSAVYSNVWKNGLSLWRYAVSVDGSWSGAQNNLGIVFIGLNDYEKALGCFNKALAMRPEYADALNNRALIEVHQGKHKEAVSDLNTALTRELTGINDCAKMRVVRGLALEELHDNIGAVADYSTVIENPGVEPNTRLKALQARARVYLVAGYVAGLKKDMESILKLPDPSGEFHRKAEGVLKALNSEKNHP
jgi:tetratricopeptide (TPR) repeat protein